MPDDNSLKCPSPQGTALVTGASSGLGAIYAERLARRGYGVILVARSRRLLEDLRSRLAELGSAAEVIVADLIDRKGLRQVEEVLRSTESLTMLVNGAGVRSTSSILKADVEQMETMIALNTLALVRLTYAAVPGFVARRRGTIVNIASLVALAPELLNGVYGGTKAFVLAFSQSLHHELAQRGVRVQAVLPGASPTEFWSLTGQPLAAPRPGERQGVMSVEDVVDAALSGLDLGEIVTIPALPDLEQWDSFDAARVALRPNHLMPLPARRYRLRRLTG
jgi:short-subunit dehydrogenase